MKTVSATRTCVLSVALLLAIFITDAAFAHQPFFEDADTTANTPMVVTDPEISTALYATLDRHGDIDFFRFEVSAGQTIEVGIAIPQIEGQREFAPTIGVIATGLDQNAVSDLPAGALAQLSDHEGAEIVEAVEATNFFEPFSRTAYWQRQRRRITFPNDGDVVVVVWHPQATVGRYTLVVGQREVLGGDPAFARKLREYWTPVVLPQATDSNKPQVTETGPTQAEPTQGPIASESDSSTPRCSWLMRLLASLFGASDRCQ